MRRKSNLPPGFVTGRVVDESGAPLADATISVCAYRGADDHDVVAQCGADGRFRIGPLAAQAAAKLYLDAPSHGRERVEDVVVFPGSERDVGDLVVPRGLVATGRVVDEAGRPLAGATVSVLPVHSVFEGSLEGFGGRPSLTTAGDGRFATPRLAASEILLTVNAPGRVHVDLHVASPGSRREHDLGTIALLPATPFRGRVVTVAGSPVAGASVCADVDHDRRVATAADGTFEMDGQSAQPRFLAVRAPGFVNCHGLPVEDPAHVVVVLETASQVTGTVVDDESGAPLRPSSVSLGVVRKEMPHLIASVENGSEIAEDGSFRVWYEDAGRHVVTAVVDGYAPEQVDLGELERPRVRHGVTIRMRRDAVVQATRLRRSIVGHVKRLPGDPRDALASLWHSVPGLGWSRRMVRGVVLPAWEIAYDVAPIAADGSFRFDDAGTHPCALRIDWRRGASFFAGPFEFKDVGEHRLELAWSESATLTGRVAHVPDGFAGRIWVIVSSAQGVTQAVRVTQDDRFSIELPAGRHAIRAGADALRARSMPEFPGESLPEPGSEEMAAFEREAAALIRPLLEVDLAPGERRDVGEVPLPDFLPDA